MTIEAPPAPAAAPAQLETPPPVTPAAIAPAGVPLPPAPVAPVEVTPPAAPVEIPKIGPDGKLADDWFLALGDEFAPHAKDLGKHKDLRSLITELDYFRKNGVEYPGEGAPSSSIERFRKIAGVPDTAEGYGLTAEAMALPAGMEFDSELASAVAAAAHATHAPPATVAAMAKTFNEILAKRTQDAQVEYQQGLKAAQDHLVAEWRGDFAQNASTVRHLTGKLAEASGIAADSPALQQLANTPEFARMMLHVSKLTQEDGIRTPTGFGDLRSAQQKIDEIKQGRDPLWSPKLQSSNEQDRLAVYEHMVRLRESAAS
jgi:hypothetical protein